jgi:hypothetical protein
MFDFMDLKDSDKDVGLKFDEGKPTFSSLPPLGLRELGKTNALGRAKYGDHNWRKGITVSRSFDAIMRHWLAALSGEECDPIDGNNHLAAIAWNALVAIQMINDRPDLDDRYKEAIKP